MLRFLLTFLVLWLSYLPSVFACEGCKEPSSVNGASGVGGISFGFSVSVLFMLAMVGCIVGGFVWMMVRSCKQLEAHHQMTAGTAGAELS